MRPSTGWVDIHCHLVPGVDDGSRTLEESLAMCAAAEADGTRAIVATPHQRRDRWPNPDRARLKRHFDELVTAWDGALSLSLGAEISVDSELLDEMDRLPGGTLQPLAGSRYLLLEYPPVAVGPDPRSLIHEMIIAGWRPILAHPERIRWLGGDLDLMRALVEIGARVQLTAMSVTGDLGDRSLSCAEKLLDEGLAHFVASDAHGPESRPPIISRAYKAVVEGWGEDMAARLTIENPTRVLEDLPIG